RRLEPEPAWPAAPSAPSSGRQPRGTRWALLAALLALAAIAGAIAAIVLTSENQAKRAAAGVQTVVQTVTGRQRTVVTTVTAPASTTPATTLPAGSLPASAPVPGNGNALNDAGYAKLRAGDYRAALPLLRSAVSDLRGAGYPDEAYANYNLGYTLLRLGRCREAIGPLEQAQRLEPQRPQPGQALAQAQACK
ncbi:MAG TPA: tetratricopeptide repeat protein, partial [Gaiellaceae bacterium]